MLDNLMLLSNRSSLENVAPTTQRVDACIKALIKAQGKIKLAVEDLNADGMDISEEEYALLLVRNKTALYDAVQAISLLHTFDNFVFASTLMKSALGDMSGADVGKTYTSMLQAIKDITTPKVLGAQVNNTQMNFNMEQKIMESLPPHVVQAIQTLKSGSGSGGSGGGESEPTNYFTSLPDVDT